MKPYEIVLSMLLFVAFFSLMISIWTASLFYFRVMLTSVFLILTIAHIVKVMKYDND